MRWPLRYQILVPFAGLMLAVLVAVSALNAYLAARRSEQQILGQLRGIAHTLQDASFPLTDAVLRQTRGLSGAEFVLLSQQGAVLASSLDAPRVNGNVPGVESWRQLDLGSMVVAGGERYFQTALAMPRRDGGAPAWLHILYPERIWRDARWQAAFPPLVVGTTALAVAVLWALAIAGRLSRPILLLRRQMSRLAQGDFQAVSLPARDDELRDLVGSVNTLAGQLEEMRRVIKRSERLALLGQLSGGLAHHLRNDTTGARIALQLHQRHCREIDQESLEVALRQLTLTEEHLKRFLAAGQPQPLERAACDLRQVIDDLLKLVEPACLHRHVTLDWSPSSATGVPLQADADQLRQMLLNLVLNAVEAAGPGGSVRIELASDETQVEVRVVDSGPGPPAAIVDRLFEPFATGKPEGIGLGLTVARQIAEAHGGCLRFESQGETCFVLSLPLDGASAGQDGDSAGQHSVSAELGCPSAELGPAASQPQSIAVEASRTLSLR